jgi:hypothetical protein
MHKKTTVHSSWPAAKEAIEPDPCIKKKKIMDKGTPTTTVMAPFHHDPLAIAAPSVPPGNVASRAIKVMLNCSYTLM